MFGLTNQVMGLCQLNTLTVCWSHSYSLPSLAVFHRGLPEAHTLLQEIVGLATKLLVHSK